MSQQLLQSLVTLLDFFGEQHGSGAHIPGDIIGVSIYLVQLAAQATPFVFRLLPQVFRLSLAKMQGHTRP